MTQDSLQAPVNYAPSPDAFPTAPRKVRMRRPPMESLLPLGCISFFVLAGIASFVMWLGTSLLVYSAPVIGTLEPGEITAMEKIGTRSAKHRISFTFQDEDGAVYFTYLDARPDVYDQYKVGDKISVRFLRSAPIRSASIEDPHTTRTSYDLCYSLCILSWNLAIFAIAGSLAYVWRQRRRLAQLGTPTIGHVTSKRVVPTKTGIYHVSFSFRTPDGAERHAGMDVNRAAYESLAIGQEVTILYDPTNPLVNSIYRCGEFDVLTSDYKTL